METCPARRVVEGRRRRAHYVVRGSYTPRWPEITITTPEVGHFPSAAARADSRVGSIARRGKPVICAGRRQA